jgi:hypothetical protein
MTPRTRYIPELVYALAFSSISVHLFWQRRAAETDRRHLTARLSILGELAARLHADEPVSDAEVFRLRRLAETVGEAATHPGESVGWREVIFGRKESGEERAGKEELERRELERGASSPPPTPCKCLRRSWLTLSCWHIQSKVSSAARMIPHRDRDPRRRCFYQDPHVFLSVLHTFTN